MFLTMLAASLIGAQFSDVSDSKSTRLLKSVFYFPFDLETYTPLTKDNIETKGVNVASRLLKKEKMLLDALKANSRAAKIDLKRIRLKVVPVKGEIIYMDASFVAMIGARQFRLSSRDHAIIDALFYDDWLIGQVRDRSMGIYFDSK